MPGVPGVIDLIRAEFPNDSAGELESKLAAAANPYQTAFSHLLARRGQNVVNDVVKRAVWQARKPPIGGLGQDAYVPSWETTDEVCRAFDSEYAAWDLPPGAQALGALAAFVPDIFGQCILTTNFDPLVEVAVGTNGASFYRTVLHLDGNISQTMAVGCHVIHLHGYWHGTDTLHTPLQLTQSRPRLKASLARLLKSKTLVVMGYGGWDDAFTRTLFELVQDDHENTEVIWTLYKNEIAADSALLGNLKPGLDRGLVTLYGGIDCHQFLPGLAKSWGADFAHAETGVPQAVVSQNDSAAPASEDAVPLGPQFVPPYTIKGSNSVEIEFDFGDQDRPPLIEHYVGREQEAGILDNSDARIIYLTGIGGEGKSALAADYFQRSTTSNKYDFIVWRDCKEESERFDSQLISIVHALGRRQVSIAELSQRPSKDILDLFASLAANHRILFVFDNVDHYVDLERGSLAGLADQFAQLIEHSNLQCRVIYTCRPSIKSLGERSFELRLKGLDLDAARELFHLRNVDASDDDITRAHELTGGHAFWLDLIAAQVGRNPEGPNLEELLGTLKLDETGLPVATLQSIWDSLKEREQIVLRGLAEAVRPLTVGQLADYLSAHLRWNQLSKAVKQLRNLNLVVVKIQEQNIEAIELHPVVRAFVRMRFARAEQTSIVESILKSYLAFFGIHRAELAKKPKAGIVTRWIEAAEVATNAQRYDLAFEYLSDVKRHYQILGQTHDFIRVAYSLMMSSTWSSDNLPKHFDDVFTSLLESLSIMGRDYQCVPMLEMYRETIPHKNFRYINYCDLMSGYFWSQGDHLNSIKWGVEGVELKRTTNVDTNFDSSHHLALAQRDSGAVDEALVYFLKGKSVETVISEPADRGLGGAFYGNIGRCLHFMGQINQALNCYKKSAVIIEEEMVEASLANKGYIRQWVGELLYAKGDLLLASACFSASMACWDLIAPPKAELLAKRLRGSDDYTGLSFMGRDAAEKAYASWIKEG